MRVWSWVVVGAVLAMVGASCPGRAPAPQANAQPAASPGPEQPAEHAEPAPEAEATDEKTEEVILEHARHLHYDNNTTEYELTGDVVLRHEDGVLRAQTVRVNSETNKGSATGDLSFADEQTVVTANRLEIDFHARHAVFTGDVRMVTQKKPEGEKQGEGAAEASEVPATDEEKSEAEQQKPFREYWEERTEIRCPELEYFYREHRAVARGGITARQKDRWGRADEAVYTDQDELLVLSGSVEIENDRGETFRADKITISVAEDWVEAEGAAAGRFLVEEEEEVEAEGAQGTGEKQAGAAEPSAAAEPAEKETGEAAQ